MDSAITTAIISAGLAAVISAMGYIFKARIEIKKSSRLVLYYLMEIRYAINTNLIDPEPIYKTYMEEMTKGLSNRGIPVEMEGFGALVEAMVYSHLSDVVSSIRVDIEEHLITSYEDALKKLASEKPILAYRLRGKDRMMKVAKMTTEYADNLDESVLKELASGPLGSILSEFSKNKKGEARDDIADFLDSDILTLAWACGIIDYIKCRVALKKTSRLHRDFVFTDVDELIDKAVDALKLIAQAQVEGLGRKESEAT